MKAMKGKRKTLMLPNALLLLAVSAFLAQGVTAHHPPWSSWTPGHADSAVSKENDIVVSSQEEALHRLWSLQDGQRLQLEVREVRLNATVTIAATNVVVYGSEQRTRIRCPDGGGAFLIRSQNVTLVALELSNCRNSTLKVEGGHAMRPKFRTPRISTQSRNNDQQVYRNHVSVIGCLFENNTAPNGAALYIDKSELRLRSSIFVGNIASHRGGALLALKARIWIENSSFVGNEANSGGAIYMEETQSLKVVDSTFRTNSAVDTQICSINYFGGCGMGGAIQALKCQNVVVTGSTFHNNTANADGGAVQASFRSEMAIENSSFDGNSAGCNGGAVHARDGSLLRFSGVVLRNNSGVFGGGVSLTATSNLIADGVCLGSIFVANTAFRGGGLYCFDCDVSLLNATEFVFQDNVAADSGGGAFMAEARILSTVQSPLINFVGNAASRGGGLAARDCKSMLLCIMRFTENTAVNGGGFHISSAHGQIEEYKAVGVYLGNNHACSLATMQQTKKETVSKWLKARERFLSESERDWLQADEHLQGRGGGAFIALHNQREDSNVSLELLFVNIENNSANVGGGMCIENGNRKMSRDECKTSGLIRDPCLHVKFDGVMLAQNTAYSAGGGLFVRSPHKLGIFGISETSFLPEHQCTSVEPMPRLCYINNNLLCDDYNACYGEQFASGVRYLELQNVHSPLKNLRSGDRLVVHGDTNKGSPETEGITIAVKDALGRITKGKTTDSELSVILLSKWTKGQLQYSAVNGIITITSTEVFGYDITANLTIQSDDERKINASLEFSTLPCPDGQLPTKSKSECFRCSAQSYAFEANATKCHECEKNAMCGGTTMLVPDEGYWHSTPFSPFIRRCAIKKACSFENRTQDLTQYYSNSTDILSELQYFNTSANGTSGKSPKNYTQCADGYEGLLCGQCADGFGHASDGGCTRCSRSLVVTVILTVLGVVVLFLVLTGKVGLAVDGIRKQVSSDLKEERRAIASTLEQHRSSSLLSALEHETSGRLDQPVNPPSERRDSGQGEVAEQFVDEGTSATAPGTQRALQRVERQIEEPLLDSGSEGKQLPSAALSAASGLLVATYNILFNYTQLSTTALTLDVQWGAALKYLFAVNGAMGRVMRIEFLPLDCAFRDRDHDEGTPNSIIVLWLQICFPLMSMAFYVSVVIAIRLFRGEMRMSKYEVDVLPSLRLICVVVYLAYCIDLVAGLLKIFNCVDLSTDSSDDHIYKNFETPDLETVWLEDTSVTCWKGAHRVSAIFAAMGLAVCLCVIVSMVVSLHRGSERGRLRNPEFVRRYGILYLDYRTDGVALHWESVLTVRRMLLAAVQVYASHKATSGVEIGILGLLIFTFLALQDIVQPFENDGTGESFPDYAGSEVSLLFSKRLRNRWVRFNQAITLNDLEGASLFMTLSLFMVAGCICGEELNNVESALLLSACFILNGVFFLFMIYRLWYGVHQYLDAMAEEKELSFTDAPDNQGNRNILLPVKLYRVLSYKEDKEEEVYYGNDNL